MNVSTQAHVESQIPAYVVGIVIDHDAVAVPEPAITVMIVVRGNGEVVAVKPETVTGASGQHPDVATAKTAGKMAVLPGMIQMVMDVFTAPVVADPSAVGVDMGSVWMVIAIAKMPVFPSIVVLAVVFARPMGRNVFVMVAVVVVVVVTAPVVVPVLRQAIDGNQGQYCQQLDSSIHFATCFFEFAKIYHKETSPWGFQRSTTVEQAMGGSSPEAAERLPMEHAPAGLVARGDSSRDHLEL